MFLGAVNAGLAILPPIVLTARSQGLQAPANKEGVVMANDRRSAPAVRVLVVEDFAPFRQFVCSMLGRRPGFQIVGEVSNGLEAVRIAEALIPDIILLDLGLPTLNGMKAAQQIRALSPQSRIIFVTQEADPDIAQEALNAGAAGYVVKTTAATDLPAALDAVLHSRQFVSGGLAAYDFSAHAEIVSSD
jgi:DNA-binding NarL/FixJ family response regulator